MMSKLTVVILTKNEAIHITRAIENVLHWADNVIILDSYSQDNTVEIAEKMGAIVLQRHFDNYKNQRMYAIEYCKSMTEWMLFLDADEYLLEELKIEIKDAINKEDIAGYCIARRAIFMGKWIKHGGYYPTYFLRLFRPQLAAVHREINEHIVVNGKVNKLKHDFVDQNLKNINFWIEKHNHYATFESNSLFLARKNYKRSFDFKALLVSSQANRKLWVREHVWNHLPFLIKPFLYFLYRYVFRLGFLDGREGLIYHFLQGCWFPFLIDVKCLEIMKK